MKIRTILTTILLATAISAVAETVLLDEDFNGNYNKSFPYVLDDDGQEPHRSIASIFYSSAADAYMPWWVARDASTSTDLFMASHSYYSSPAESNDWIISIPLAIPTEGFVLSFDAQSVPVRSFGKLSDLSVFITTSMVDPYDLPEEPTVVFEKVPYGNDPDNCENDWTHYTYRLDAFAGKEIYISFVNANFDNDILCIDNVKVSRHDAADLTLGDLPEYTGMEQISVSATVVATATEGLSDWTLTLTDASGELTRWSGDKLACGESRHFEYPIKLAVGNTNDFTFTLTASNTYMLQAAGKVTRMAFMPVHRVFYEETTSLHCGNCPVGDYVAQQLTTDPVYGDRVLPVAVHIAALGYDPMAMPVYYGNMPVNTQAPMVWIDRDREYTGFIPAYDCDYDIDNPASFAYRVARRIDQPATIDVDVEASWVIQNGDTVAVDCKAKVRPAIDLKNKDYRVAFILTENNVGLDLNPYWIQENYLSGKDFASRLGGWCDLGEKVVNARYHDVARAISNFIGHPGSLPAKMDMGGEYTFEYRLNIPDTYQFSKDVNMVLSDAIRREMCEITAIVIDNETERVVNSARVPMSDKATKRFTAADLLETLGIDSVTADSADDSEASAIYYDMRGMRVATPAKGMYIRVTPAGVRKVIR